MRGGWSSPTPYTPMDGENKAITTKKKKKDVGPDPDPICLHLGCKQTALVGKELNAML